jgi:hypothetical protein
VQMFRYVTSAEALAEKAKQDAEQDKRSAGSKPAQASEVKPQ